MLLELVDVQQRMENALVVINSLRNNQSEAVVCLSKNKVEGFRLSNKPLISEVLELWLDNSKCDAANKRRSKETHP